MFNQKLFLSFWQKALGVSQAQLLDGKTHLSTDGAYLTRNNNLVYIFSNFTEKSKILTANSQNLNFIKDQFSPINIINQVEEFSKFEIAYDDVDMYLKYHLIRPKKLHNTYILEFYSPNDANKLNQFLSTCSEDERDILDLHNSVDKIWVIIKDQEIVAVGSYCTIPSFPDMTDITLLTSKLHRNNGLASNILHAITEDILSLNLIPRYRVGTDNLASIKVAEKLGLSKFNQIKALKIN